jgi:hypothetical protein
MWRIMPQPACPPAHRMVFERDLRVDAMQLVEVDRLHVEPPQAHLHALTQVLGTADWLPVRSPVTGSRPHQTALGRDRDPLVGVERRA